MSRLFQNIDPPSPSPPGECEPRLCCGGRTHSPGGEGGGGSIFLKTRDIGLASYSNNLSTFMPIVNEREKSSVVDPAAMDPRYFGRLDPDLKRIGNADPDASGQK